jgi:hypothetical protein
MKVRNMMKFAAIALAGALMVGCGEKVEVPPGHVGKLMTKDGYQETLIPTSKFRLPFCNAYCDKLVVLDTTDNRYSEPLKIYIPADKLNIDLNIEATLRIDPKKANSLFAQLPQTPGDSSQQSLITSRSVYNTYGKTILEAEVRAYLTQLTIGEIASNIDKVNQDLTTILQKVMADRTPFQVIYAGVSNVILPPIITTAQEKAAERREQIEREEAEMKISTVRQQRELKEAQLQRQIEKEKAETKAIEQRAVAESLTPQYLRMRELEIEQIKAEKWNGTVPQTVMGANAPGMLLNIK